MKTIETQRLILRSFQIDDVSDVYEYASSPNVGPNAGWTPHANRQESFLRVAHFIQKDEVWAIEHREHRKVIGSIGVHEDSMRRRANSRMIGYVLSENYWGQGLMTEAVQAALTHLFGEMGLSVVSVGHFSFNQRSKRVIEKCGFKLDGVIRHAFGLPDGSVTDEVCYSLLREEFEAAKRES